MSFLQLSFSQSLHLWEQSVWISPGFFKFPQYGKVSVSSQTLVARMRLIPSPFSWLTFLDYPGTSFLIVHRTEQHFVLLTPRSSWGPVLSQRTPGSESRNQEFSWILDQCLWVAAWPGWALWCPCPLDPGPCPGSSPWSATCGSPCCCQGWEARSHQPLLKRQRSQIGKREFLNGIYVCKYYSLSHKGHTCWQLICIRLELI